MGLTDYQLEVLFIIQSKMFSGEDREIRLKECYMRHFLIQDKDYNYYFHIETLHNLMTKIYKSSEQDMTYEEVLESLLDEINSQFVGFHKYNGLNLLNIQYMFIILKLAEAKTKKFLK